MALGVLLIECSLENPLGATQPPLFVFLFLLVMSLFHVFFTEVRSEERGILERAGVVQSLTVGVAPIVVVIASVCTFTLHMALGYDLTAAEVFIYLAHNQHFQCILLPFCMWDWDTFTTDCINCMINLPKIILYIRQSIFFTFLAYFIVEASVWFSNSETG